MKIIVMKLHYIIMIIEIFTNINMKIIVIKYVFNPLIIVIVISHNLKKKTLKTYFLLISSIINFTINQWN
jgi:hypothetical protein